MIDTMIQTIPLTIVTPMHSVPLTALTPQLWQLTHQTVLPLEILVVCTSPDDVYREELHKACAFFDLVRVIDAPRDDLNLSYACNVGIRQSCEDARYISCMASGLLFSRESLEALDDMTSPQYILEAPLAELPADYVIGDVTTLWDRWTEFVTHLRLPVFAFSPGSLSCTSRSWLHDVHGYDEVNFPSAYADSDLIYRGSMAGREVRPIPWGKMQMVHIAHERRYALTQPPNGSDASIVRNDEHWGTV